MHLCSAVGLHPDLAGPLGKSLGLRGGGLWQSAPQMQPRMWPSLLAQEGDHSVTPLPSVHQLRQAVPCSFHLSL